MKRTPLRKKRKGVGGLKNKLWTVFSKYIRMKDADENGMVKCISCPTWDHYDNMQAGHWRPKSLGNAIYFLEINVHPQCPTCNLTLQGNPHAYAEALKEKYGPAVLEEIDAARRKILKMRPWEYEELIEKYTQKIKELGGLSA